MQDIVFHIVWILCWFIASVDWAVAFNRIDQYLDDYMDDLQSNNCPGVANSSMSTTEEDRDSVIYVQAQIAVVSCRLLQCIVRWNPQPLGHHKL